MDAGWDAAAWIALLLAFAGLAASLAEAALRGGRQRPPLRPPIEVMFLAPIAAVLVAVSFTAHRAIVDTLNSHIRKVMTPPDQMKLYEERGVTVIASSPEEAAAHLESEQKKWGRVIKERGIKAE